MEIILIYGMIYFGSALMIINILLYFRLRKQILTILSEERGHWAFAIPAILLLMFLAGYLTVGLLGRPDIIISAILLGGSIFVFVILQLIRNLMEKIWHTEQLKISLQAAREASEAKTVFLSNMSHDIRTPMNAIIGYTKLAESEDLSLEEAKEYLDKIQRSGKHLLDLINDILEMSRIESGRLELNETPVDLLQISDGLQELFAEQMRHKELEFHVDHSGISDRMVICDRTHLTRILVNLVSNAWKFTSQGGSVDVVFTQKGGLYEIRVKDTGIGMSEEFASRMFDAFERERTSTVSGIQGTGLGMAITSRLVDAMKGSIQVKTKQGKGTEMIIRLPLQICEECQIPQEADRTERETDFSGKRLLLAEDMEINREIAQRLLEQMGFEVEAAHDGVEAVEKMQEFPPGYFDAVLMDIQMPRMDGYEATRRIRDLSDPVRSRTPIIAVTANAFYEDRAKAVQEGMDGHVAKPLDPEELRTLLTEVLMKKQDV